MVDWIIFYFLITLGEDIHPWKVDASNTWHCCCLIFVIDLYWQFHVEILFIFESKQRIWPMILLANFAIHTLTLVIALRTTCLHYVSSNHFLKEHQIVIVLWKTLCLELTNRGPDTWCWPKVVNNYSCGEKTHIKD